MDFEISLRDFIVTQATPTNILLLYSSAKKSDYTVKWSLAGTHTETKTTNGAVSKLVVTSIPTADFDLKCEIGDASKTMAVDTYSTCSSPQIDNFSNVPVLGIS